MLLRWKTKIRWAVPLLLMGVAGCSKVELPRNAGGTAAAPPTTPEGLPLTGSDFEKTCHELAGMKDVPVLVNSAEYPLLIEFIKNLSPLFKSDNERFLRAHARALRTTNEAMAAMLEQEGKTRELHFFKSHTGQFVHYGRPNLTTDLPAMLFKVMELSEGSQCGGAYLAHFYSRFVKELDPFGDVSFGLTEARSPGNTLNYDSDLPDEIRNAPAFKIQGLTIVATLPRLLSSDNLKGVLHALEQGHISQNYRVILFDLRYSNGIETPVLADIRASAAKGWGAEPVVIWTNRETRGVAALLSQQFSTHPNVLVLGSDHETYGYGRKLVQQSTILAPGLAPLTLTISSEFLQPPAGDPNADGYRMRFEKETLVSEDRLDKAVERSEQWIGRAQPGDLGQPGTQPESTAKNDPAKPTDPNAAAGSNSANPSDFSGQQVWQDTAPGANAVPAPQAPAQPEPPAASPPEVFTY